MAATNHDPLLAFHEARTPLPSHETRPNRRPKNQTRIGKQTSNKVLRSGTHARTPQTVWDVCKRIFKRYRVECRWRVNDIPFFFETVNHIPFIHKIIVYNITIWSIQVSTAIIIIIIITVAGIIIMMIIWIKTSIIIQAGEEVDDMILIGKLWRKRENVQEKKKMLLLVLLLFLNSMYNIRIFRLIGMLRLET